MKLETAEVCNSGGEAEKGLLAAVLMRAARDLAFYSRGRTPAELRIATDALAWIFEPSLDDSNLTSFHGICQALSLDPQQVRERILEIMPQEAITLHCYAYPGGG